MAKQTDSSSTLPVVIITAVVTAAVVGAGMYWWMGQKQSSVQSESQTIQTKKSPAVKKGVSTAFEKAVNQKDYKTMKTLLADNVYFIIEATECCGNVTKEKAVSKFSGYMGEVKTFNFSQDQQLVKQMKVNMGDHFEKYTIGIGDNGAVLGYHLNAKGEVDDIYIAVSHQMFDLE